MNLRMDLRFKLYSRDIPHIGDDELEVEDVSSVDVMVRGVRSSQVLSDPDLVNQVEEETVPCNPG